MSTDTFGMLCGFLVVVACFAAWVTHIVVSFNEELWGFLIGGMMFFPVGIIHGFYLWFT